MLDHDGVIGVGHAGHNVIVHKHPLTKRFSISAGSYWQDDFDALLPARKIEATSSEGKAIVEDVMRELDIENAEGHDGPGLSIKRVYKILDVTHRRSFVRQRDMSSYADNRVRLER